MVLNVFSKAFTWVMLFVIILNLSQRKIPHSAKKRRATLLWASDFLLLYILLIVRDYFKWPSWLEWVMVAITILPIAIFHKIFWPFRIHCSACGKRLSFNQFLGDDDNFCSDCFKEAFPEEAKKIEKKTMKREELLETYFVEAERVDEIPWESWRATETCVLTYLVKDGKVLLILKKKGMGSGYFNAPGGHIEIEETKKEAAVREFKEETGLDVKNLEERGTLYFQFKDGIRMLGYVFFADEYSGEMVDETEETKPFWCPLEDIDYTMMWEDDRLWLPKALEGKHFEGYFIFDDRKMLDSKIIIEEEEESKGELTLA